MVLVYSGREVQPPVTGDADGSTRSGRIKDRVSRFELPTAKRVSMRESQGRTVAEPRGPGMGLIVVPSSSGERQPARQGLRLVSLSMYGMYARTRDSRRGCASRPVVVGAGFVGRAKGLSGHW